MLDQNDLKKIGEEFSGVADLEDSITIFQRRLDRKLNLLISFLRKKHILDDLEVKQLDEFHVFPSLQK